MTHYLTKYAHFTNKFDLDKAASAHKNEHWQAMNHTDRDVLDVIRRYSVKFGAAHLKHKTIEGAIGKSNATVRRSIRKLAKLNIIDKIHYVRPVMNGLGANIYAIKPFEEATTPKAPEKIDYKQAPKQELNTTETTEQPEPVTLFERMKALLSSTIGDHTHTRRFFGVYRQRVLPMLKFRIHEHKGELFEQLGMQALIIATQATKKKNIKNLPGYYSGILRELIDQALFSEAFMDYELSVEEIFYR